MRNITELRNVHNKTAAILLNISAGNMYQAVITNSTSKVTLGKRFLYVAVPSTLTFFAFLIIVGALLCLIKQHWFQNVSRARQTFKKHGESCQETDVEAKKTKVPCVTLTLSGENSFAADISQETQINNVPEHKSITPNRMDFHVTLKKVILSFAQNINKLTNGDSQRVELPTPQQPCSNSNPVPGEDVLRVIALGTIKLNKGETPTVGITEINISKQGHTRF